MPPPAQAAWHVAAALHRRAWSGAVGVRPTPAPAAARRPSTAVGVAALLGGDWRRALALPAAPETAVAAGLSAGCTGRCLIPGVGPYGLDQYAEYAVGRGVPVAALPSSTPAGVVGFARRLALPGVALSLATTPASLIEDAARCVVSPPDGPPHPERYVAFAASVVSWCHRRAAASMARCPSLPTRRRCGLAWLHSGALLALVGALAASPPPPTVAGDGCVALIAKAVVAWCAVADPASAEHLAAASRIAAQLHLPMSVVALLRAVLAADASAAGRVARLLSKAGVPASSPLLNEALVAAGSNLAVVRVTWQAALAALAQCDVPTPAVITATTPFLVHAAESVCGDPCALAVGGPLGDIVARAPHWGALQDWVCMRGGAAHLPAPYHGTAAMLHALRAAVGWQQAVAVASAPRSPAPGVVDRHRSTVAASRCLHLIARQCRASLPPSAPGFVAAAHPSALTPLVGRQLLLTALRAGQWSVGIECHTAMRRVAPALARDPAVQHLTGRLLQRVLSTAACAELVGRVVLQLRASEWATAIGVFEKAKAELPDHVAHIRVALSYAYLAQGSWHAALVLHGTAPLPPGHVAVLRQAVVAAARTDAAADGAAAALPRGLRELVLAVADAAPLTTATGRAAASRLVARRKTRLATRQRQDAALEDTIDRFRRLRLWADALAFVSDVQQAGVTVRPHVAQRLVTVCQQSGRWAEALQQFGSVAAAYRPDGIACTAAIRACTASARWADGMRVFRSAVVSMADPHPELFVAALELCFHCREPAAAASIADLTWHLLFAARLALHTVQAYWAAGQPLAAVECFHHALGLGLVPDVPLLRVVVAACRAVKHEYAAVAVSLESLSQLLEDIVVAGEAVFEHVAWFAHTVQGIDRTAVVVRRG